MRVKVDSDFIGDEIRQAVSKFERMMNDDDYYFNQEEADKTCFLMENFCYYHTGEDMEGNSLLGKKFRLSPYQVFIVYAIEGFYYADTIKRVVKTAFISMGRKNGKTRFLSALDFALSIKRGKGGYSILAVADLKKNSRDLVHDIQKDIMELYSSDQRAIKSDGWRLIDNNDDASIVNQSWGAKKGGLQIHIKNEAGGVNGIHGEKKKLINIDEIHNLGGNAEKIVKQASNSTMNAVATGLTIMTTTAGKGLDSYCYNLMQKELEELKRNKKTHDSTFSFIAKAVEAKDGSVDFQDRKNWYKANPNLGVSVSEEVLRDKIEDIKGSRQATSDFIAYNLNVYQPETFGEFKPEHFLNSDIHYDYTLKDLKDKDLTWYGGADLSKRDDMTGVALYTEDEDGTAYIISHVFIPETTVIEKKRLGEMNIEEWLKEGTITICKSDTITYKDVADWFSDMESKGFKIKEVGYDKALSDTFEVEMIERGFEIYKQAQTVSALNRGFYRIEEKALDDKLYYMNSDMFYYNVNNLLVKRGSRGSVEFSKKAAHKKIDAFAAAVDACIRYLWWREIDKEDRKKKEENKKKAKMFMNYI